MLICGATGPRSGRAKLAESSSPSLALSNESLSRLASLVGLTSAAMQNAGPGVEPCDLSERTSTIYLRGDGQGLPALGARLGALPPHVRERRGRVEAAPLSPVCPPRLSSFRTTHPDIQPGGRTAPLGVPSLNAPCASGVSVGGSVAAREMTPSTPATCHSGLPLPLFIGAAMLWSSRFVDTTDYLVHELYRHCMQAGVASEDPNSPPVSPCVIAGVAAGFDLSSSSPRPIPNCACVESRRPLTSHTCRRYEKTCCCRVFGFSRRMK